MWKYDIQLNKVESAQNSCFVQTRLLPNSHFKLFLSIFSLFFSQKQAQYAAKMYENVSYQSFWIFKCFWRYNKVSGSTLRRKQAPKCSKSLNPASPHKRFTFLLELFYEQSISPKTRGHTKGPSKYYVIKGGRVDRIVGNDHGGGGRLRRQGAT